MRFGLFLFAALFLAPFVLGIASQPVSFEGMSPLKNGNNIDWLTGSNMLIYDGITFTTWNNKTIFLIWQQNISQEEKRWVPGNKSIGKALAPFSWSDEVYITSGLSWGTAIPQGTTVVNMVIIDQSGRRHAYPIQAGVHTAEWNQGASPAHNNDLKYVLGPSQNPPWNGKEYLARIPLGEAYIPTYVYFEYVNPGTSGGAIGISAVTFNRVHPPAP